MLFASPLISYSIKHNSTHTPESKFKMNNKDTVMRRTFALKAQKRKGVVVLLDIEANVRKIPATVTRDTENHVEFIADRKYVNADATIEVSDYVDQSSPESTTDTGEEEDYHTSSSDSDNDSEATEINEDLPTGETTSPRRERTTSEERIPSPEPPRHKKCTCFQNMYTPTVLLHSNEEYLHQREVLIQQYLRDSLDLFNKYEHQASLLKKARRRFNQEQ